jgi:hypothetical protein
MVGSERSPTVAWVVVNPFNPTTLMCSAALSVIPGLMASHHVALGTTATVLAWVARSLLAWFAGTRVVSNIPVISLMPTPLCASFVLFGRWLVVNSKAVRPIACFSSWSACV